MVNNTLNKICNFLINRRGDIRNHFISSFMLLFIHFFVCTPYINIHLKLHQQLH
nr:MAG TPA: hypothetical protein [Bacteriophage sp.]